MKIKYDANNGYSRCVNCSVWFQGKSLYCPSCNRLIKKTKKQIIDKLRNKVQEKVNGLNLMIRTDEVKTVIKTLKNVKKLLKQERDK